MHLVFQSENLHLLLSFLVHELVLFSRGIRAQDNTWANLPKKRTLFELGKASLKLEFHWLKNSTYFAFEFHPNKDYPVSLPRRAIKSFAELLQEGRQQVNDERAEVSQVRFSNENRLTVQIFSPAGERLAEHDEVIIIKVFDCFQRRFQQSSARST